MNEHNACPRCRNALVSVRFFPPSYFVYCLGADACDFEGPKERTVAAAYAAWDAIPREIRDAEPPR